MVQIAHVIVIKDSNLNLFTLFRSTTLVGVGMQRGRLVPEWLNAIHTGLSELLLCYKSSEIYVATFVAESKCTNNNTNNKTSFIVEKNASSVDPCVIFNECLKNLPSQAYGLPNTD